MSNGKPLVLITGATGHVGYAVLLHALKAGYSVRAALRSLTKLYSITSSAPIKALNLEAGRLTFMEVPDITAEGAYDKAIKDCGAVIHVASPLIRPQFTDFQRDILDPAVKGTLSLLRSAASTPNVKRVVITSSVVAVMDLGSRPEPGNPAQPSDRGATPNSDAITDIQKAYQASKIAALNATDDFMSSNEVDFDLVNIMPAYVLGRKELATTAQEVLEGSNMVGAGIVVNGPAPWPVPGITCHVDDVAEAHVKGLSYKSAEGKKTGNFAVATPYNPDEVFGVVEKAFPKATAKGIFKKPDQQWIEVGFDAAKTEEKLLKRKFRIVEEQIKDTAEQVLELMGEEKA